MNAKPRQRVIGHRSTRIAAADPSPLSIVIRFPARGANQLRPGPVPDPLVGVILTDADVEPLWADRFYG